MPLSKKLSSAALFLLLLGFAAVFLSAPARYGESVLCGLMLWLSCIVPTALPLFVVLSLLINSPAFFALARRLSKPFGALFRVSGAGAGALLLSLLSGYPAGARAVSELAKSGKIGREEAFYAACLASTSGPSFCLGAAAGMFGSAKAGLLIFLSHLMAVGVVSFLLPRLKGYAPRGNALPPSKDRQPFLELLAGTVQSLLSIGALIALFFCLKEMLFSLLPPLSPLLDGTLQGLLEVTAGVNALSKAGTPLSLAISCAEVSFGGLCVNSQQLSFLAGAGVKPLPFLFVKLLHGAVAFAICLPLAYALF